MKNAQLIVGVSLMLKVVSVSAETDYNAYTKKGFDECFEDTLSGERIVVPCNLPKEEMTPDEVSASLALFEAYEQSPLATEVAAAAKERDKQPRTQNPHRKKLTPQDLEDQRNRTREERASYMAAKAEESRKYMEQKLSSPGPKLRPEVASKVGFVQNGKYRVRLTFINNGDYPKRYSRHAFFADNPSDSFTADWEKIIFENYLGRGYQKYSPDLAAVNKYVVMLVLVNGSKELEKIVRSSPLHAIAHVATPREPLEEVSFTSKITK